MDKIDLKKRILGTTGPTREEIRGNIRRKQGEVKDILDAYGEDIESINSNNTDITLGYDQDGNLWLFDIDSGWTAKYDLRSHTKTEFRMDQEDVFHDHETFSWKSKDTVNRLRNAERRGKLKQQRKERMKRIDREVEADLSNMGVGEF